MQTLLAELGNYQNTLIVAATWAVIEVTAPVAETLAARYRWLHWLATHGKRCAAVIWCSALVWVPDAQPALCGELAAEGCQTIFNRISIGVILGVLLSTGHWGVAKTWAKYVGKGDTS